VRKLNAIISSKFNRSFVLTSIHRAPTISRVELAGQTGLGKSAITHILQDLLGDDLVEEAHKMESRRKGGGRPRILLRVKYRSRFIVCVEIDLAEVIGVIADLAGEEVHRVVLPVAKLEPIDTVLTRVIDRLRETAPAEFAAAVIIGVSAPGAVDGAAGVLLYNMYHNWRNFEMVKFLNERYGLAAFVENNAKLGALGELHHLRTRTPIQTLIYLYIRESPSGRAASPLAIGGAAILNGAIWRGANCYAGEVSRSINMPYLAAFGELAARNKSMAEISFHDLLQRAAAGDADARGPVDCLASFTGAVIGQISTFLDPEGVVIHFRPSDAAPMLIPGIEAAFQKNFHHMSFAKGSLIPAQRGDRAQIEGIVHMAQQEIFIDDSGKNSILIP